MKPFPLPSSKLALLAALLLACVSMPATAIKIGYQAAVEVEDTDNPTQSTNATAQPDTLVTTRLSAAASEEEGTLTYKLGSSWRNVRYTDETFADQDYVDINFSSNWLLWDRRLNLQVKERLSQRRIDSLGVDTPANIQDTNVFSVTPLTSLRLSRKHQLQLIPSVSRYYYEATNNNNTQQSLGISWLYSMYRTMSVSLTVNSNEIDYDDPAIFDTDISNASLRVNIQRRRSNLSLSLGTSEVERAGSSTDGSSSSLVWSFDTTGSSSFRLSYSSQLTDQSNRILVGSFDDDGNLVDIDFDNRTDVFRNKEALLRYNYIKPWLGVSLTLEASEQDYANDLNDRETRGARLSLSRTLTASIKMSFSLKESVQEIPASAREDERSSLDLSLNWKLNPQFSLGGSLKLEERDSTIDSNDFEETSVMVRLRYGVTR